MTKKKKCFYTILGFNSLHFRAFHLSFSHGCLILALQIKMLLHIGKKKNIFMTKKKCFYTILGFNSLHFRAFHLSFSHGCLILALQIKMLLHIGKKNIFMTKKNAFTLYWVLILCISVPFTSSVRYV